MVLVGLVAGAVVGSLPGISVLAACALSLATAVAFRPVPAAYLWLAFTPLIVGIDRGVLFPLLRPNEALLLGLLSALAVRWLVLAVLRRAPRPRLTALDGWFAVLALTGSALPLLWTVAQGRSLGLDEFLSAANVRSTTSCSSWCARRWSARNRYAAASG